MKLACNEFSFPNESLPCSLIWSDRCTVWEWESPPSLSLLSLLPWHSFLPTGVAHNDLESAMPHHCLQTKLATLIDSPSTIWLFEMKNLNTWWRMSEERRDMLSAKLWSEFYRKSEIGVINRWRRCDRTIQEGRINRWWQLICLCDYWVSADSWISVVVSSPR